MVQGRPIMRDPSGFPTPHLSYFKLTIMAFGGASSSFSAAFMRGGPHGGGGGHVSTRQLFIWVVTALLLGVCGWSSGLLVTYALDVTMMTASPSPSRGGSAAARSPAQKQSKKGKKGNAGSGSLRYLYHKARADHGRTRTPTRVM